MFKILQFAWLQISFFFFFCISFIMSNKCSSPGNTVWIIFFFFNYYLMLPQDMVYESILKDLFFYIYIYLISVLEWFHLSITNWWLGWRIRQESDCLLFETNFYSFCKSWFLWQKAVLREHRYCIKNSCCSSYFWYSSCAISVTYHFTSNRLNLYIAESLKSYLSIKNESFSTVLSSLQKHLDTCFDSISS